MHSTSRLNESKNTLKRPKVKDLSMGNVTVPFLENVNKFQNPLRRPLATTVFLGIFIEVRSPPDGSTSYFN
jgi:hypothetical protein